MKKCAIVFGSSLLITVVCVWSSLAHAQAQSLPDALCEAVVFGQVDKVAQLLKDHPELINAQDKGKRTPLGYALLRYDTEQMNKLLVWAFLRGRQIDINVDKTKEILDFLLGHGADVNGKGRNGETPFHLLVKRKGPPEIVQFLLSKGADISLRDDYGATPFDTACFIGQIEIVNLMLSKTPDLRATDKDGSTALHYAALGGHESVVERLLEKGAEVRAPKTNGGDTPLHLASLKGHTRVAQVLLDKGAPASAKNNNGDRPLELACSNGHKAVVELLLNHGVDPKATTGTKAPIVLAGRNGHYDIVDLLREKGVDIPVMKSVQKIRVATVVLCRIEGNTVDVIDPEKRASNPYTDISDVCSKDIEDAMKPTDNRLKTDNIEKYVCSQYETALKAMGALEPNDGNILLTVKLELGFGKWLPTVAIGPTVEIARSRAIPGIYVSTETEAKSVNGDKLKKWDQHFGEITGDHWEDVSRVVDSQLRRFLMEVDIWGMKEAR